MRDALEKSGKDVTFIPLHQEGHGSYDEGDTLAMYKRMLDFLGKHLVGGKTGGN